MRLFDTHCHFETADPQSIREILVRARSAGVTRLTAVGGSPALNAAAVVAGELASASPDDTLPRVFVAQGFDRDQAAAPRPPSPPVGPRLAARGEIGLDYHYSPETRAEQLRLFAAELEEARRSGLPVVIHTREADEDTLALLREIPSRGVIHCYTGTPDVARKFLDLGFYISISGIVTFKAAQNVRDSALVVPDDRILIETDSPYLAPVPRRGNPNEPAFLVHTCEFLAALRGASADAFAELTFANGLAAFA